ncbi:MAG: hypothetical protein K9L82_02135 [Chromatiaceae bacterium]|nr:hypothetical protein [Chromatiaceae bacterium]
MNATAQPLDYEKLLGFDVLASQLGAEIARAPGAAWTPGMLDRTFLRMSTGGETPTDPRVEDAGNVQAAALLDRAFSRVGDAGGEGEAGGLPVG